jgi:hypothetical protein
LHEDPEEQSSANELHVIKNDVTALLAFVNSINEEQDRLTEPLFLQALELLGVSAVRMSGSECIYATFYELTIDNFKAIFYVMN